MTPTAPTLLTRLLYAHLAIALLLGVGIALVAFLAVRDAAEEAAARDIAADVGALRLRYRERGVIGIAEEIDFRAAANEREGHALPHGARDEAVYLLLRSDGTRVVGNLARWPEGVPRRSGALRFDGAAAAAVPGQVLGQATAVDGAFLLLVGRRLSSVDALVYDFAPIALAILATLSALAVAITLRMDRRYRRRIAAINYIFDRLRGGALDRSVAQPRRATHDELDALAQNVDTALDAVVRTMRGLDTFSQAAAHELIRELTRLRDAARSDRAAGFAAASEQLIALLRQLLELTRIESGPNLDARHVDLAGIARESLALYADAFDAAGVTPLLDTSGYDGSPVLGHAKLIGGAVVNLVENALKHAPEGSVVAVRVATTPHALTLSVEDRGPGSTATDIGGLIGSGASPHASGYGFGLRFVQAVVIRHGARVAIADAAPGLRVVLAFPRA